jgi:hypothetical protein
VTEESDAPPCRESGACQNSSTAIDREPASQSSVQAALVVSNGQLDSHLYRYTIHRAAMATMNPSIKRGSAELAVLAVLEQQPLHG